MQPCRAPVRPRYVSPSTGDALPLDDAVGECLQCHAGRMIEIAGAPGSGKTTAMQHLAAVLPPELGVEYRSRESTEAPADGKVMVVDADLDIMPGRNDRRRYELAPWTDDDCIEYVMKCHSDRANAISLSFSRQRTERRWVAIHTFASLPLRGWLPHRVSQR